MIDKSTVSLIITAIFLIPIIWNALRGLSRGIKRQGVRIGCTVTTAIVSFFVTTSVAEEIMAYATPEKIKELLASVGDAGGAVNIDAIVDCLSSLELILAMPVTVLVLPIVFSVTFNILKVASNLIAGIICTIFGIDKPDGNTTQVVLGGVVGLAEGLIISLICMLPFAGIFGVFNESMDVIREKEGDAHSEFVVMYDENVAYIADHFAVKTTEALGGEALLDAFATHEVNGVKVNMRNEIVSIVSVVMEFKAMGKINFADLSDENKAALESAVASLEESDFLTLLVTGVVSDMGKAMEKGIIPISAPAPYDVILNPVISMLATSNPDNFKADVDTVLEVYFLLSDYGVMKSFGEEGADAMSQAFTVEIEGKTVVARVVEILNSNERTGVLVKALTDMSLTILAQQLGGTDAPFDVVETYDSIKTGVQDIVKLDPNSPDYKEVRNEILKETFEENNIVLEDDIIDGIGNYIDENYGEQDELTDEEFNNIILSYYDAYKDSLKNQENQ